MKSNVFFRAGALLLCLCALVNAQSPVVINEVNTGTPDFIEYRNVSLSPVDISGWTQASWYATAAGPMTAEPTLIFPAGTILAPGGFFVTSDSSGSPVPSLYSGFNYFWVDDRTVEVALTDPTMMIADYMLYDFFANAPTGNIPAATTWTGTFTGAGGMLFDDKSRNWDTDTDMATDWSVTSGPGTPFLENPGQFPIFGFDASIACNPAGGGVDFSVMNGTPGNSFYIATAAVFTGIAPNGSLLGIEITFAEIVAQIQTGAPFVGVIGASGGSTYTFNIGGAPCGMLGIPLDYVGIEFTAGLTLFVQAGPAHTVML